MFLKNVDFEPYVPMTPWRKCAIGTWHAPGDPQIYTTMDVDAGAMQEVLVEKRSQGKPVTPTTIVARAVALAIRRHPEINSVLRFGRLYRRRQVNIFLQVVPDAEEDDLTGIIIKDCDRKSIEEVSEEIRQKAWKIRRGEDLELEKSKAFMGALPGFLSYPILKLLGFLSYTFNLWIPFLGAPRDAFGSAMVTPLGPLELENGFALLDHYTRCPMVVTVGKIREKPVVVDGQVVARPVLTLCFTFDHRIIDGIGGIRLLRSIRSHLLNPSRELATAGAPARE